MQAPAAATLAASLSVGALSSAVAGPTGGVVVEGQGSISAPTTGTTVIDQASQRLQLNWSTFNVGANESVRFNQPSSSAVAINRILDQSPSQIFGRLQANGQVVLANPNGLLIGRTAQLNVNSLVASSLDAIDFDAASGRYRFSTSRGDIGAVINEGSITAGPGGSVTLLGGRVSNSGTIVADFGTVNLAAGRAATLDLAGDGLLRLEVGSDLLTNSSGSASAVENSGTLQANGGQVLLTAGAVQGVFANLINNTGVVRANRIDNIGGVIQLVGAQGGVVGSSGTLDASGGDAASSGGTIEMLGERVGLFDHAVVDVSGEAGGGKALIGGDYQGKNPDVLNAQRTYVSTDATINADAGAYGDGGRIIVWSDEVTRFDGQLSARGGAFSGNGGFAEVSGKRSLAFTGGVNLTAARGAWGTLLLDPDSITIDASSAQPGGMTGNTYDFSDPPASNVLIGASTLESLLGSGDVILRAATDITQSAAIDATGGAAHNSSLTLESHGTMSLGSIALDGGALTLNAGTALTLGGALTTNNGPVSVSASSPAVTGTIDMQPGSSIDAGSGSVTLAADRDIRVTSINTSTLATITSGQGNIVDDLSQSTRISADSLSLNAPNGAIGSSSANLEIDTDVRLLSAVAGDGGVYINEQGGLTLTSVAAAGLAHDVIVDAGGDVTVGAVSAPNAVKITAAGAIVDDNDDTTRIAANSASLTATGAIGGAGGSAGIDTNVGTLVAHTTNSGGIYVRELNGLTLTDLSAAGTGSDVVVTSDSGDITVGTISALGDAVSLTAGSGGDILNDATGSSRITADSLSLTARNIGTPAAGAAIDTDVTTLDASATLGVYIRDTGGLTLHTVNSGGGNLDVVSVNGDIVVGQVSGAPIASLDAQNGSIRDDGSGSTRITAGTLTLKAFGDIGTSTDAIGTNVSFLTAQAGEGGGAGSVYIAEQNAVTLNSVSAVGAGNDVKVTSGGDLTVGTVSAPDQVTLATTGGSIVDDGLDTTRITGAGLTLTATAALGALGNEIDTAVSSLTANAGNGGVFINAINDTTLENVTAAGGTNGVTVTNTAGSLIVKTAGAPGDVSLTASGAIADDGSNATRIGANVLTLAAGAAIGATGANNEIDTDVTSLTATAGHGGVYIGESNGLTLTSVVANDAGSDINVTSNTGDILVKSVSAPDGVTLTATAGSITNDASSATVIAGSSLSMTAGTAIGAVGNAIDTNVGSLSAAAGNGGVYVTEANGLTLTSVTAAGAGNDVGVTSTTGNIVVGTVTAPDLVTLVATAGALTDDGLANTRIGANALTLQAATAIGTTGAGNEIDTNVGSLAATAGNGGVYVGEANGLTLANVTASGVGNDVNVSSATGDIVVATVTAPHAVTLAAVGGAITDDGSDATVISGPAGVSLSAATSIGTVTDFATVAGSSIDVQTTGPLTAAVASNTGQINLNIIGTPTLAAGAIALGSGTGRAGTVILQSASDLNAAGLTAGAINIGAGNATAVGLSSGGVLTLPAGGGFTDAPPDRLLVRGATDVVDNDATPREFGFDATSLNFQSGAAGGATVLDTNVSRLDASIGNSRNLTVNEVDGLTLGAISVTGGNIVIAAGGAISDDGDDATRIAGNDVTLTGTALGAAANELDTQATVVGATASAGGVFVREVDGLALTAIATGGAVDVRTANGALTVASAGGSGVALATAGAGSSLTVNGAINAGGGPVSLATAGAGSAITVSGAISGGSGPVSLIASGANSDINLSSVLSTTGDVTLSAGSAGNRGALVFGAGSQVLGNTVSATASSIGSSSARLNTAATSMNATSENGGIFVSEADGISLSASATGGAVDVRTANGSLVVSSATGNGITLAAGGDGSALTLNGAVNGGSSDIALSATGAGGQINLNSAVSTAGNVAISAGAAGSRGAIASTGGQVVAGALAAVGASIGSAGSRLNTTVASLDANASNGGIYVQETDGLALTASATGGALDVATLNGPLTVASASGNGAVLSAAGAGNDLTLNGALNGGSGAVSLTAGGSMTLNGSVGTTGNVSIATAGTGSVLNLNSSVTANSLEIAAGPANGRGAIVAGSGNQITATDAIIRGSAIGTNGAKLNTSLGSLDAMTSNGGIFVNEADGLALDAVTTHGALDVRTANGALTVASAVGDGVMLATGGDGNALTLNGGSSGGVQGRGGDVTLMTSGAGSNIVLNDTVQTTGAVAVLANGAGSSVSLNSVVGTPGSIDVEAGSAANRGAIIAGANNNLAGGAVKLVGSAIGASGARVNTSATSLSATGTNGGVFMNELDGVALSATATGGSVDVQTGGPLTITSASGDSVALAANGGGILLNGPINAGAGAATLTANGGAITAGAGNQITAGALTATGSSIGSAGSRLNTTVTSLNATSTGGGTFVSEADGLNLTAQAVGGVVDVQTGNGALVVGAVTGTGVSLSAGGAGSGITLNGEVNAGTGDISLTAGTAANRGAIVAGPGGRLAGATLTALGSSIGSSNSPLSTSVDALIANASAGDVHISELNGIALTNVSATGNIEVSAASGDITVSSVSASNDATLTAKSGAIADDGDDSTRLSARAVTLLARSIGAPSTLVASVLDSKPRLDLDATTLDATATAGGIYIDELNGLTSASVHASGGASGDIELLTATGDLNLFSVSASDTLLLSAGGNIVGLTGLGAISAQAAELRAGGADPSAGHIGALSQPLSLQLSAGNTLRLFVPQTIDPNDASRAPSTLPGNGVLSTLSLFSAPSSLAVRAGFGQFQGLSDLQFTSPAEALVRSIQNQTATTQTVLGLDWASFDPNVSLFGTLDPSVCLPSDQRDEESGASGC
ncbi:MAG: filamentous hemagglutinin N-terminal domain-containing protein [Gammaproteobacteria bacterium]